MKVQIEFHTDTAAFEDCGFEEFEHIITQIFLKLIDHRDRLIQDKQCICIHPESADLIYDSNGNRIGTIKAEKS